MQQRQLPFIIPCLFVILSLLSACGETPPAKHTDFVPTPTHAEPFSLAGRWYGTAQNGTFNMQVEMDFNSTCAAGQVCARFNLATIPCSGTYTLVEEVDGVFEFRAGDFSGTCGIGKDYISLQPDGTLQYTSRGDYGETKGILSRALPVIYDDDGSPDGTTALMYLLSDPRVDLKAVNISYGEAHPRTYIQLIGGLLNGFGISGIPLGEGQDGPLSGSNGFPEWMRQSADDFWGMPKPNTNKTYPVTNAARLIVSTLKSAPSPVTIFISGPCTNLAAALRLDPGIKSRIRSVYIMGGAVHVPGNLADLVPNPTNRVAEWNIYGDPLAAYEVFTSGLDIHLVPLDATNKVKVSRGDTGLWRSGGKPAVFAADMYDSLMRTNSITQFAIWDVMTAEIMVNPSLCKFTDLHLEVVTAAGDLNGQTSVVPDEEPNVHVCLQPDGSQIIRTLDEVLSTGD